MKFKEEEIYQVQTEMFNLDSWLKVKNKKKDLKCPECKRLYEDIGEKISLMTLHGKYNTHLCNDCGRKYIEMGAIDINELREENKNKKEDLIKEISAMKNIYKIENKTLDELQKMLPEVKAEYEKEVERQRLVKESTPSEEDWEMEQYLVDQYTIFQDKDYLYSEHLIEEYFKDNGYDYFDCGQGFYEDESTILVNIGKKFFEVTIYAEIIGSKQDRGDRLYWVENISRVDYVEVHKPKKKGKVWCSYELELSEEDKVLLDKYIKRKKFKTK